ncbi:AAA family ATPase [Candidatus Binatia bacterium]|nr:AAA family ATPase [Candidatus Binatia bacterium]
MAIPEPLPPGLLYRACPPESLPFASTAELDDLPRALGQERALEALRFGMSIRQPGFNLFALGPAAAGVHEVVRRALHPHAADERVPRDWVYVHDFAQPFRPRALALPPGRGVLLRAQMASLMDDLRAALQSAFESEEYRAHASVIEEEVKDRQQKALEEIEHEARARNVALLRTPMGMGFAPLKGTEVMSPEEFAKLPVDERERIAKDVAAMQERLQDRMSELPQWQRQGLAKLRELNHEVATLAVKHLINELRERNHDLPDVLEHLDRVQADVVEHVDLFRRAPEAEGAPGHVVAQAADGDRPELRRYKVNVLVDHAKTRGAPIVYEPSPSYQNLVGRVEHWQAMGALVTDFNLIKPGALHLANGGYLLLDARKVLAQPFAWEGLKQALRTREIRIESLGQMVSLVSTVSLEPEHIPLDVKVVLIDEPTIYYLLHALDPDFAELFKVVADFDDRIVRSGDTTLLYARFLATEARASGLRELDRSAVARLVEHGARLAGDAERLTTLTRQVTDLLAEADHHAAQRAAERISADDVQTAIDAALRRSGRVRERFLEETVRGTLLVETDGAAVGQVNGLAVYQLGDAAFGRPSRITARVGVGSGDVLDIEREVELGGPLHSKGVLILSGFLAARFALEQPLSLGATLVFEQSYGGIDGDSASSAELYALLSAISGLPIAQGLAVTGSVDQFGRVQPIGGVNEKIEGFFDLCAARGLTGTQGVLIPAANVKHLMLRRDVVDAAAAGRFRVLAVEHVDQGIELLTGVPAGEAGFDGVYPEGSVNRRVLDRLQAFAACRQSFAAVTLAAPGVTGDAGDEATGP